MAQGGNRGKVRWRTLPAPGREAQQPLTPQQESLRKLTARARREKLSRDMLSQILRAGLPEPEAEVLFHPTRKWRFDYAWVGLKLALEVEGGTYAKAGSKACALCGQLPVGRHNYGHGMDEDCIKYGQAAVLGWCVIRVTAPLIRSGAALDLVREALAARGVTPGPPGLPQREVMKLANRFIDDHAELLQALANDEPPGKTDV